MLQYTIRRILLAIPVTLLFWEWVRRGQPLVLPFDGVRQRRGWLLGSLVLTANSLPAVLLAMAIVLLARPLTYAPPKTQRELTNIQIVLDASTSMVFNTYGPQDGEQRYTRFDGAMDALETFLSTVFDLLHNSSFHQVQFSEEICPGFITWTSMRNQISENSFIVRGIHIQMGTR